MSISHPGSSFSDDNAILLAAQAGDRRASALVIKQFGPLIATVCRGQATSRMTATVDFIDDVASETYRMIWDPAVARFDPARGHAKKYLYGLIANAIRIVRGQREPLPVEAEEIQRARLRLKGAEPVWRRVEVVELTGLVFLGARPPVAAMIRAHVMGGEALSKVAADLGIDRFKAAREVKDFIERRRERLAFAMTG